MNSTGVEITAGLGGFLVLFGLMLAVWFLGRDMTKRLRRMRLAEDERVAGVLQARAERASAEQARIDVEQARGDLEGAGTEQADLERADTEQTGREGEEPGSRRPDEDGPTP